MEIVALIVSPFAFLAATASAFYARQQAQAAKIQAEAARIQATAATTELEQLALWRVDEAQRAEPQFRVTATPIMHIRNGGSENGSSPAVSSFLGEVHVMIENISSRDATINHVGIDNSDGAITGLGDDLGITFPRRVPSGDQIEFVIPGDHFFVPQDDYPTGSDFTIFASKSAFFSDRRTGDRWDSQQFHVAPSGAKPEES